MALAGVCLILSLTRQRVSVAFLLLAITLFYGAARAVEVGAAVEGAIEIGNLNVPLPNGRWTVYYVSEAPEGRFPVTKVGLLQTAGKAVKQIAYLRVARNTKRGGFKPFDQCALPHYYFSETVSNRIGGAQNCWHVRAETLAADTPSERQTALVNYAKSKGVFLPLTMIGSRFHLASRVAAMRVSYGWAPDLIIKAPADKKAWRFQDWTADAVAADLRKKAVMEKMKQWGSAWHPKVTRAFSGKTGG